MASVRTEESKGLEVRSDKYIRAMIDHVRGLTGAKWFVETGTEYGDTARWASTVFPQVITIEASPQHFEAAGPILDPLTNVIRVLGESHAMLRDVDGWVPRGEPIIYYLDAHWSTGPVDDDYYGRSQPCPLLREIAAVKNRSSGPNYIFIDDVRMFSYPGYVPKGSTQTNPSLREIVFALWDYEIAVYADCFMCLPLEGGVPPMDIIHSWRRTIHKTWMDILV